MPQPYTVARSMARQLRPKIEFVDISVQDVEVRGEAGPLAIWHLLSLDAPAVATAWTWFAARAAHVALPAAVPAAMFVAVWLLYAGDRLLDGLADGAEGLEERHLFHRRHFRAFVFAVAAGASILGPVAWAIPAPMLRLYVALAVLLAAWYAVVHTFGRDWKLPKELMTGVFCAAAAFIPEWSRGRLDDRWLTFAAALYGLLIALNCWLIYSWEHDGVERAHLTTRLAVRLIVPVGIATVALPLAATQLGAAEMAPVFVAISLSAALLMALNQMRGSLDRTDLRAAADVVLLTPLLLAGLLR